MSMNLLTQLAGIDDELGARRGRPRARGGKTGNIARALSTAAPGVQSGGARYEPLGLTPVTFVNAGVTTQQMTSAVQKVFKGSRLVLIRTNVGAASPGLSVTITSIFVGQTNQAVSAQPLPVEGFAPTAFGVDMALDTVTPAINLFLNIAISAPPAAMESVTITGMILGLSLAHGL